MSGAEPIVDVGRDEAESDDEGQVDAPRHENPFNDEEGSQFLRYLLQMRREHIIPDGYTLTEDEWGDQGYPTMGSITYGRTRRQLSISLPDSVWRPRAELWAQGHFLMTTILSSRRGKT
ncbi:hypothetical protein BDN72DRAFT_782760 [Pluteus cervinus]|uniref:Uncharacterized protein n=1 Tax=Pluteus cervinus TaxID=181527 RepID=A0ACD2ZWU3_9AGAR|nr:hypothetical protein BDN72DRAFT_782760 [Pluteus cervinus]